MRIQSVDSALGEGARYGVRERRERGEVRRARGQGPPGGEVGRGGGIRFPAGEKRGEGHVRGADW